MNIARRCDRGLIHLPSKPELPTAPHLVRNSNSSFESRDHLTLSRPRFETEQDISTLKQTLNAAMIAVFPAGALKMQDVKMARHENAGHEIDGPSLVTRHEIAGHESAGHENDGPGCRT